MREKLKSSLQSLSNFFGRKSAAIQRVCTRGWNAFCIAVCKGLKWLADLLRKGYRPVRSVCNRIRGAYRRSRFAAFIAGIKLKFRDARLVTAVRSRMARHGGQTTDIASTGADNKKQSPTKKSAVDLIEDGGLTTEQIEKELSREKFSHRYRGLLRSTVYALIVTAAAAALIDGLCADCHRGSRSLNCDSAASGASDLRQLDDPHASRGRHCGVCQNKDLRLRRHLQLLLLQPHSGEASDRQAP